MGELEGKVLELKRKIMTGLEDRVKSIERLTERKEKEKRKRNIVRKNFGMK